MVQTDYQKIMVIMAVIKADKVPIGKHARQFNAPIVNEVAIVMVVDQFDQTSIIRRDNTF